MDKFKIVFMALLIATLVFISVTTYYYVKANEAEMWGMWIRATKLTEEPASYREVPANVDKWTRNALENPDTWVHVVEQDKCWAKTGLTPNVKYEGEYYEIEIIFRDPYPKIVPEQEALNYSPIGFATLAVLWIAYGAVWFRVKRRNSVETVS